jgi:hypothetical protein
MAYSKDPEGNVDSIEFYEEGIVGDTQLKTANSQLICAPFNTSYMMWWPPASGEVAHNPDKLFGPTAVLAASNGWGLRASPLDASQRYVPYDPTFGGEIPTYEHGSDEWTNTDLFKNSADAHMGDILRSYISTFIDDRFKDTPGHTIQFKTGPAALTSLSPGAFFLPQWHTPDVPWWAHMPAMEPQPPVEKKYSWADGDAAHSLKYTFEETLRISADWITPQTPDQSEEERLQLYNDKLVKVKESMVLHPRSFRDARFTINKPFAEVAYEAGLGDKTGTADPVRVTPHYNYYLQPYEKIVRDLEIDSADTNTKISLPETILPNIYGLISDMTIDESIPTNQYKYADQWQYPAEVKWAWEGGAKLQKVSEAHNTLQMWKKHAMHTLDKKQNIPLHKKYLNDFAIQLEHASTFAQDDQWKDPAGKTVQYHETSKKYYTTGISAVHIKDLTEEADKLKKFFPMYVDIEIPASNSGKVGKILKKSKFFNQFMQAFMASMQPRGSHDSSAMQGLWKNTAIIKKDSFIRKDFGKVGAWEDSLYSDPLATFWLNKILLDPEFPNLGGGALPAGHKHPSQAFWKFNHKIFAGSDADSHVVRPPIFGREGIGSLKFVNNIKWANARNQINKLIKEKVRSVREIYNGKEAYSEVLFYEIVKFRYDSETQAKGTFVQNIFLPNVSDMEALKYVDTQIKYDEEYYYQIYAHTFVVGTQYQYAAYPEAYPISTQKECEEGVSCVGVTKLNQDSYWKQDYKYAPTVYLMRVPYFNTRVTMQDAISFGAALTPDNLNDANILKFNPENLEYTPIISKPPVFPDASPLPLYGEKNKVLLSTNFNVGEYDIEPIAIDEDEVKHINKLRKNQRKLTGPITFKSDDFCGQIEVLRIDQKPFSYKDFAPVANSRIAILGGSATFGHIDDTIKPNKNYYYTFREKDVHDSYSNPSPIYQVRVVAREGEAPYTIIEMFFIEEVEENPPDTMKKLMKYIKIKPSFKQSYLDDAAILAKGEYPNSITDLDTSWLQEHIGDPDLKPVWSKNFKFRFTSKKTGKKFDLNLTINSPTLRAAENQVTMGEEDKLIPGKC